MPQLDISTYISQIFWLFLSFSTVLIFSSRLGLPRFAQILYQRRQHFDTQAQNLEKIIKQTEHLQQQIEQDLKQARHTAHAKVMLTAHTLNEEMIQHKHRLNDSIHQRLTTYEQKLTETKAQTLNQLESQVESFSQDVVSRILSKPSSL